MILSVLVVLRSAPFYRAKPFARAWYVKKATACRSIIAVLRITPDSLLSALALAKTAAAFAGCAGAFFAAWRRFYESAGAGISARLFFSGRRRRDEGTGGRLLRLRTSGSDLSLALNSSCWLRNTTTRYRRRFLNSAFLTPPLLAISGSATLPLLPGGRQTGVAREVSESGISRGARRGREADSNLRYLLDIF